MFVRYLAGAGISPISTISRPVLGPTRPILNGKPQLFPRSKATGLSSWALSSVWFRGQGCVKPYATSTLPYDSGYGVSLFTIKFSL